MFCLGGLMAAKYKDRSVRLHKHFDRMIACLALEFQELPKSDSHDYVLLLHSLRTMVTAMISGLDEQIQRLNQLEVDAVYYIQMQQGCCNLLEKIEARLRLVQEEVDRQYGASSESA